MKFISIKVSGVLEELLLYSGQFAIFYILMQLIIQKIGFLSNLGHITLLLSLVVQSIILSKSKNKILFRIIFTFLVPVVYSFIELTEGFSNLVNAAHIGFWIYALISVMLMILKKYKDDKVQYIVEVLFVSINILIYLFLYFYFDTLKDVNDISKLTIFNIFNYLDLFFKDPTHWFVMFGGIILASTIAFGRLELQKIKNRIKILFGKYVDASLTDTIIETGKFETRSQKLCILFSDIKSFTVLCEKNEPDKIAQMLNTYFEYWNSIIKKYNGTIDKYIGDAIMVIFGINNEVDLCNNAVNCALESISRKNELYEKLANLDLPIPEGFGIGCHFGDVIIGDIGSDDRKNISVIGDTVNTASRLESITRKTNQDILLSDQTYTELNNNLKLMFKNIGSTDLKGKKEKITVWGIKV